MNKKIRSTMMETRKWIRDSKKMQLKQTWFMRNTNSRHLTVVLALNFLFAATVFSHAADVRVVFPNDSAVLDAKGDFGAKGDGKADDTSALQAALEAGAAAKSP